MSLTLTKHEIASSRGGPMMIGTKGPIIQYRVGGLSRKVRRYVAKRVAFRTGKAVRPASLTFIDSDFDIQLNRLFDEIHQMTTWRLPFQYHPSREAEILAELRRRRSCQ